MLIYQKKKSKSNEMKYQSQPKFSINCFQACVMSIFIIMIIFLWNSQMQYQKVDRNKYEQKQNSLKGNIKNKINKKQFKQFDYFFFDPPLRWEDINQNKMKYQQYSQFYPKIERKNWLTSFKDINNMAVFSENKPFSIEQNEANNQKIKFAQKLQALKYQSITSDLANQERNYYQTKYQISLYKEQPFCVVIPSFNNVEKERYKHNLNSIFQQQYSNYHIIYIDDASNDGTAQKVKQYVQDHQISEEKMKIIINKQRTMAIPNIYRAAHEFCQPYQIFMIIDGDDQLIGKQVFKLFNSQFQSKEYWLMYTNFVSSKGKFGYSRPYSKFTINENKFRNTTFLISHLRAFYTKLLTLVKEKDLKDENGNWFRAANDVAMYSPILQMVHTKFDYFPEICYLYNSNTGLNNHEVRFKEQKQNHRKIRLKEHYQQLQELFSKEQNQKLQKSIGKIIPTKNLSMPLPQKPIEKQGWQMSYSLQQNK